MNINRTLSVGPQLVPRTLNKHTYIHYFSNIYGNQTFGRPSPLYPQVKGLGFLELSARKGCIEYGPEYGTTQGSYGPWRPECAEGPTGLRTWPFGPWHPPKGGGNIFTTLAQHPPNCLPNLHGTSHRGMRGSVKGG